MALSALAFADTVPSLPPPAFELRPDAADEIRWVREHCGDLLTSALGGSVEALHFEVVSVPQVDDGCTVLRVVDAAGKPGAVVQLSSSAYPEMVERALDGVEVARAALSPDLARHLIAPMAHGRRDGRSCAVLPYCKPLHGRGVLRRIDNRRLEAAVLPWLYDLTRVTLLPADRPGTGQRFRSRLLRIASMPELNEGLREGARTALARLASGAWRPRHLLMHGDLWRGNILLGPEGRGGLADRFVVIDWPGAQREGYALYDLVRLALSLEMRPARLAREVDRHCHALGCERVDATGYLLAGLGQVAMFLGHFPLDRFVQMAHDCHDALPRA